MPISKIVFFALVSQLFSCKTHSVNGDTKTAEESDASKLKVNGCSIKRAADGTINLPVIGPDGKLVCPKESEFQETRIQLTCQAGADMFSEAFGNLATLLDQGEDQCVPGTVLGNNSQPVDRDAIQQAADAFIARNQRGVEVALGVSAVTGTNIILSLRIPRTTTVGVAMCRESARDPFVRDFYLQSLRTMAASIGHIACQASQIHSAAQANPGPVAPQTNKPERRICIAPALADFRERLAEGVKGKYCLAMKEKAIAEKKPYCKTDAQPCAVAFAQTKRTGRTFDIAPAFFVSDVTGFGGMLQLNIPLDNPPANESGLHCVAAKDTQLYADLEETMIPYINQATSDLGCDRVVASEAEADALNKPNVPARTIPPIRIHDVGRRP